LNPTSRVGWASVFLLAHRFAPDSAWADDKAVCPPYPAHVFYVKIQSAEYELTNDHKFRVFMQADISLIAIIKDWIIPVASVLLSIWFASSAKKDAERAQNILDQINDAIQKWQSQIMNSTVSILDSLPQVIEGKSTLAKIEAVNNLLDMIRENAAGPKGSSADHQQTMHELSVQLTALLNSMRHNTD